MFRQTAHERLCRCPEPTPASLTGDLKSAKLSRTSTPIFQNDPMSTAAQPDQQSNDSLADHHVAIVGKLAGMTRREARGLIRSAGGHWLERLDPSATLAVVGEANWPLSISDGPETLLDPAARRAVQDGRLEIITETQLWQRLGFDEGQQNIHQLYTPAMLASLLKVPLAVIRRWHRRGLIVPTREVRKLPYFDFQQIAAARRLAELLAAGVSPQAIEKKLAALARLLPDVEHPLVQLSVIVQGRELLLRQGDGLIDPGGQLRLDFDAAETERHASTTSLAEASAAVTTGDEHLLSIHSLAESPAETTDPEQLLATAAQMEDEGHLAAAVELYRTALVVAGPDAEVCFLLAELLYRQGDVPAARERYYMAIELDEDYVEARANLGCVLAETGQLELAIAAFEGALSYHGDYPDVHYHLARTLDELDQRPQAERHWREFLRLAPDSPWAAEARERLEF